MGLPFNEIVRYVMGGFNPLSWFSSGEQGAWYDPSDLTTLFQDSAGTTPVTLSPMEQPVGLMLDKSKGLVLGSELVTNGDFSNGTTGWNAYFGTRNVVNGELQVTSTGTGLLVSSGITTVIGNTYCLTVVARQGTYTQNPTIGFSYSADNIPATFTSISTTTNTTYKLYYTANSILTYIIIRFPTAPAGDAYFDNISVKQIAGNHAFQATAGNRPLLSARVNLLLATATLSTQSVTTVATNYTLAFTGAGTVTLSGTATGVLSSGSNTFTATAGTLTLTVSGSVTLADLRPTNSGALLPPYQRVNTSTDYDTVGFPLYLKCNGTSSAMSTGSINFTATDKMTVVTGVRKLSDAFDGIVCEFSVDVNTNIGSFAILAPLSSVTNRLGFSLRGSVGRTNRVTNSTDYPAPTTLVLSSSYDLAASTSANEILPRVNSVIPTLTTTGAADSGTGNFGNYPLYIFSRAGTSVWLNGNFYGAIIRGAQSDTNSVVQTENYMAKQIGITF